MKQEKERLLYEKEVWEIEETPLMFCPAGADIFTVSTANNHRGYAGFWSIEQGKLYITSLLLFFPEGKETNGLQIMFGSKKPVYADWYSGSLSLIRTTRSILYRREVVLHLKVREGRVF